VAGQRQVLLQLRQLGRGDNRQRVLLTVHHALLERHIQLAERDLLGGCAEGLENVDGHRIRRGADLETLEVRRLHNGPLAVGDVADAVVPPAERHHADLAETLVKLGADGAFQHLEGGCGIREQEGKPERCQLRQKGRRTGVT